MKTAITFVLSIALISPSLATGRKSPKRQPCFQATPQNSAFRFAKGQHVYVVTVEASSRNLSITRGNLEIERKAKDDFRKLKVFRIAPTLRDADFVFFVLFDDG